MSLANFYLPDDVRNYSTQFISIMIDKGIEITPIKDANKLPLIVVSTYFYQWPPFHMSIDSTFSLEIKVYFAWLNTLLYT